MKKFIKLIVNKKILKPTTPKMIKPSFTKNHFSSFTESYQKKILVDLCGPWGKKQER